MTRQMMLENERVLVQKLIVPASQSTGACATYPEASPDGSVGWMPTIDVSEQHQSGDVGPASIDLIWVTLKK
jgi:hypothetical protein